MISKFLLNISAIIVNLMLIVLTVYLIKSPDRLTSLIGLGFLVYLLINCILFITKTIRKSQKSKHKDEKKKNHN
jgi:hypothetical protein